MFWTPAFAGVTLQETFYEIINNTTPTIRKIPLIPPKGEIVIPLFGKEGRGEIF